MISINNLKKSYGKNIILNDLNLEIYPGEITALVGKNGSGKSTLIRILSGLTQYDSGEIKYDKEYNYGVLLGGDVSLYKFMTGYEIIEFFGKLHNISDPELEKRIEEMDSILEIKSFLKKRASTYSRGMKQKIAMIVSLIHDPDFLMLDEPSTGLDLEVANDVINLIKYLKTQKKTILIATHNIFEISDLSDNIAFLKNGKISKNIKTKLFFDSCQNDDKSKLLIEELGE